MMAYFQLNDRIVSNIRIVYFSRSYTLSLKIVYFQSQDRMLFGKWSFTFNFRIVCFLPWSYTTCYPNFSSTKYCATVKIQVALFYDSPNQACWSPCTSIARPKSANLTAAFFFCDASNKFSGLMVNNWLKVTCNINQSAINGFLDRGILSGPSISESQSKQYWNTLQHWWLKVIWKYWSLNYWYW